MKTLLTKLSPRLAHALFTPLPIGMLADSLLIAFRSGHC